MCYKIRLFVELFPRFSQRLISFQLKLRQSVESYLRAAYRLAGADVFYVYVLRSLRNDKRYVGYTGQTPVEKLAEHNGGATRWTRNNRPLKLIHCEEFADAQSARERENFLKSGRGRQWLNDHVQD